MKLKREVRFFRALFLSVSLSIQFKASDCPCLRGLRVEAVVHTLAFSIRDHCRYTVLFLFSPTEHLYSVHESEQKLI